MRLDPSNIKVDPTYIQGLVDRSGMDYRRAADAIGIGHNTLRDWLKGKAKWSYPAQYALECLVKYGVKK